MFRQQQHQWPANMNSLATGKFEWNFRQVIFKRILVIGGWGISCEITPIWMSPDFTDDQSTLVQVMDWCRQATSHYLSQYLPRSVSPYGITRPQWVKHGIWNMQKHWLSMAILSSNLLHGVVHHPSKLQADTWNPLRVWVVTLSLIPGPSLSWKISKFQRMQKNWPF